MKETLPTRFRYVLDKNHQLTASSGTSSSVLTTNGQNPLMCLILKNEIWGTLPSCFIKSRVQVLADFAPRGMRVRSSVRSPDKHKVTVRWAVMATGKQTGLHALRLLCMPCLVWFSSKKQTGKCRVHYKKQFGLSHQQILMQLDR